jgi:hypothetical protein
MGNALHPVHRPAGASGHQGSAVRVDVDGAPAAWRPRERLGEAARALMNALPERISVTAIALDFPHVLNRLAVVWPYERAFEQEMWALLFDDRAEREGFPFSVEEELLALQAYRLDGKA